MFSFFLLPVASLQLALVRGCTTEYQMLLEVLYRYGPWHSYDDACETQDQT